MRQTLIVIFVFGIFFTLVYCSVRIQDNKQYIDSGFYYHREGNEIIAYPDNKIVIYNKEYITIDTDVVDTVYLRTIYPNK